MANTLFQYEYRDKAGNSKGGEVCFSGDPTLDLIGRLNNLFAPNNTFVASQIKIKEVFLWSQNAYPEDDPRHIPGVYPIDNKIDHGFHSFTSASITDERLTDEETRSFKDFVDEVERQSHLGWKPIQRFQSDDVSPLRNLDLSNTTII